MGQALPEGDVLVVDAPAGLEGDAATAVEAAEAESVPVVLLVEFLPPEALAATQARAWLRREAGEEELAAAVRAVAAGLSVVDPALERRAVEVEHATLTEREREVLGLVALGMTNRAIALALGISEHTAKFHVGAVLSKLGAQSRAEAVSVAVRLGVLAL
jgi:DNA-binding NarL/FixJ family response regulator